MPTNMQTVEITLSRANSKMVAIVAAILKRTPEEVVSFCLKGSTNPKA